MSRYRGPKNKISRRYGVDLGLKGPKASMKLAKRLNVPPGQHGPKGRKRNTQYGEQLHEKQKVKFTYGVTERQLGKYFSQAAKVKGATGAALLTILESRLDNVIYRLGFCSTRAAARQLVSHGHVVVNDKKVNIPSYMVRPGEVITFRPKALSIPNVAESIKTENQKVPAWLERQAAAGRVVRKTSRDDIETDINEQLIVEHYSR
jgi:small subunit ribosomal protein S4